MQKAKGKIETIYKRRILISRNPSSSEVILRPLSGWKEKSTITISKFSPSKSISPSSISLRGI